MTKLGVDWQLVPPHTHRRNSAERAIRTWKNHFLARLASTDPDVLIHLWDRLIPQATTTLNLLRSSCINPRLSAEAQLNGQFDYNRTPTAPPGTRVIIHEKPSHQASWAPHGAKGWYVDPALHHYRCWAIYLDKTASERIGDMVEFFTRQYPMPKLSSANLATKAAIELLNALRHLMLAAPFAPLNAATMKDITRISEIFHQAVQEKILPVLLELQPQPLPCATPETWKTQPRATGQTPSSRLNL